MYNDMLTLIILCICCRRLFSLSTTCKFETVSGYRPALLSKENSARSRLQCAQFCAKDKTCAGFSFSWVHGMCISYVMDTGVDTVRFIPEDEPQFYIKSKFLNHMWHSTTRPVKTCCQYYNHDHGCHTERSWVITFRYWMIIRSWISNFSLLIICIAFCIPLSCWCCKGHPLSKN